LWGAAKGGFYKIVKFLLDQGANVNAKGCSGNTLITAVHSRSMGVLNLLIQSGAAVNAVLTALVVAAKTSFLKGVKVLLNAGASTDYISNGEKALLAAAKYDKEDNIKLLLKSGADPNAGGWPAKELFNTMQVTHPFQKKHCKTFSMLLNGGLKVGIEDWRYIYKRSIKNIRKCKAKESKPLAKLPKRRRRRRLSFSWLKEGKCFLESFEALPEWQAVKGTVPFDQQLKL
jgi:hypothetical protein